MSENIFNLESCRLCPRECKVNRLAGQTGFCGFSALPAVARCALHFWEEPCISGTQGSGTVFFSGCTLSCVYCQNHEISQDKTGKEVSIKRLAQMFLEQQSRKAHNINLVTPAHFVPQIKEALILARQKGLTLPVVYNTHGYEKIETLKSLKGLIQVYLPDYKYAHEKTALTYSSAPDYPQTALAAIEEMISQTGSPRFDDEGLMIQGVIIRHLVLPGHEEESKQALKTLFETFKNQVYFSIMNQFTPMRSSLEQPELNRPLSQAEYDRVVDFCADLGMEQAFIQEENASGTQYIPPFNLEGV